MKYCQKNGNKITCDYIDKVSYKDKDVIVRRFFLPSYNNKGKKVLIPRKEYELSLLSTIDDNNRVLYQKEKRFSKSDTVNKISRYIYDEFGNLIRTDFYSQANSKESYLYSDCNEINYENGKIAGVIHYRETMSGIK